MDCCDKQFSLTNIQLHGAVYVDDKAYERCVQFDATNTALNHQTATATQTQPEMASLKLSLAHRYHLRGRKYPEATTKGWMKNNNITPVTISTRPSDDFSLGLLKNLFW